MRLNEFTSVSASILTEAVHTIPLTEKQFDELKERMSVPIPAELATIALSDLLESDDLSDELFAAAAKNPNHDARPIIANWMKLNMPDEMHRFDGRKDSEYLTYGLYSTLHGYSVRR